MVHKPKHKTCKFGHKNEKNRKRLIFKRDYLNGKNIFFTFTVYHQKVQTIMFQSHVTYFWLKSGLMHIKWALKFDVFVKNGNNFPRLMTSQ